MRLSALALALMLAALMVGSPANADDPAPVDTLIEYDMDDQHDESHTDQELRGVTTVVIWFDRKGADHREDWVGPLRDELRGDMEQGLVRIQAVGHVKGVPFFVKGKLKKRFREQFEKPVLLDWKGAFNKAYAPTEEHVNLMVFDADGKLVHRTAVQESDRAELDALVAAVKAACDLGPPGMPSAVVPVK